MPVDGDGQRMLKLLQTHFSQSASGPWPVSLFSMELSSIQSPAACQPSHHPGCPSLCFSRSETYSPVYLYQDMELHQSHPVSREFQNPYVAMCRGLGDACPVQSWSCLTTSLCLSCFFHTMRQGNKILLNFLLVLRYLFSEQYIRLLLHGFINSIVTIFLSKLYKWRNQYGKCAAIMHLYGKRRLRKCY